PLPSVIISSPPMTPTIIFCAKFSHNVYLTPSNNVNATFSFTGSDSSGNAVSVLCQLDGGAQSACTSSFTYSGLAQGSHSFSVVAVDLAGNQSIPAAYTWTINTTPPSVNITSTPLNPTTTINSSFTFF